MQKHHWKRLFFFLLGVNLATLIILLILFNMPLEDKKVPGHEVQTVDSVSFVITTERNDVNRLIDNFIRKEAGGPFTYHVRLVDDEVVLFGELPFAGMTIDMKMTFEPTALENGDLLLEQKKFSIGRFNLPVPLLLQIIQESYPIPDWITIQPNQQRIHVSLYNMILKSGSRLKVQELDLKNDQFEFLYEVPVE